MAPRESLIFPDETAYGQRWVEGNTEFRLVKLNKEAFDRYRKYSITKTHKLLTEQEWRNIIGLRMSPGWTHFLIWPKEPNILCFKRPHT